MPIVDILLNLAGVIVSTAAILWGASWLVESAARIAKRFEISELVIGLTVVAFGTSAPEFAVSITSAIQGYGNISVSNVVGSNIFNLGFILGGCALLIPIQTSRTLIARDGTFLIGGTLLLCLGVILYSPHTLDRTEGIVLFSLLILYLLYLYYSRHAVDLEEIPAEKATWKDGIWLILGILFVVGGSHFLVEFAVTLAKLLGVSQWAIGVTIVAAGTSVPEMATSLMAAWKGRHGISAGNLIGSDIFNMFGVLGLAAIIRPLSVSPESTGSVVALFAMVALTLWFMRTGWKVSRLEGFLLVLVACLRWGYDLRASWLPTGTQDSLLQWLRSLW